MKKAKSGTTSCSLNDLLFPVELRNNKRHTNREYSKVVTGVIPETIPFFSEYEMNLMKESLNEADFQAMIENNPKTKIINRETDLNYCSPVYELVPNEKIFPEVERIFNEHGIAFTADYSHTQNARFYGNYRITDPRFSYRMAGTNDNIDFIYNFQHSYNGLTKYKGTAGYFRLICSNGLVIAVEEMQEYNLCLEGKHTAAIQHSLIQFSSLLTNLVNNIGTVKTAITDKYELLGGVWVAKPEDRIIEVLKAAGIAAIDNNKFNTVDSIMETVMSEANDTSLGYNGRVNEWLLYNGINQYIHDDDRNVAAPEKRREIDSKVLEYMLAY